MLLGFDPVSVVLANPVCATNTKFVNLKRLLIWGVFIFTN